MTGPNILYIFKIKYIQCKNVVIIGIGFILKYITA